MLRRIVAVAVVLAASSVRADPARDATAAFSAFVGSLATAKPALDDLDAFLPPAMAETPLPQASDVAHLFRTAPKIKVLQLVISPSGGSAWLAATLGGREHRASAVLAHDAHGWHVLAADISAPVRDRVADPDCGEASHDWESPHDVPAELAAPVRALLDAISSPKTLVAMISDDRRALVFGSAPGETFHGGAAIKKVFAHWEITGSYAPGDKDAELPASAGATPDGELIWVITPIIGPAKFCTMYRGFYVLAKQHGAWKLVHQHYSSPS